MRLRAALLMVTVILVGLAGCDGAGEPNEPVEPAATPTPAEPSAPEATPPAAPASPGTAEEPSAQPRPLAEIDVSLAPVADADAPTAAAVTPDDTLLIAERAGTVHPVEDGGLGSAVLDLSDETTTDVERGLLDIAFHPDGDRLLASFTDPAGDSVVASFGWDGAAADPDDRRTLLEQPQPFGNHNGGGLAVGPDDALYLGLGDGGDAGDPLEAGQDRSTPLGALLRLDPDTGAAAAGNPFAGDADADDRVWAYGLRNPWRFAFDPATDDLYIADVGQSDREEVNWMPAGQGAGANYGWNLMEGTTQFAGPEPADHVAPIYEYETHAEGCSITGGHVYRGEAIDGLQGAYVFSDYCAGGVRALRHDGGELTEAAVVGEADMQVVSIEVDADGELYLLTFDNGVLRVEPGG